MHLAVRGHLLGARAPTRGDTRLHVWYLSDSVLDVSLQESSPVPLAMPLIIPTMWFQNNEIDKVRVGRLHPQQR